MSRRGLQSAISVSGLELNAWICSGDLIFSVNFREWNCYQLDARVHYTFFYMAHWYALQHWHWFNVTNMWNCTWLHYSSFSQASTILYFKYMFYRSHLPAWTNISLTCGRWLLPCGLLWMAVGQKIDTIWLLLHVYFPLIHCILLVASLFLLSKYVSVCNCRTSGSCISPGYVFCSLLTNICRCCL